ncbi:sarcosine oxidase subunit gamma family protein [uncultured Tateyamaria sp.]|uniref:sarcosine oxidase subunit gamma n=1 Tax=uncultured Tateyamaria sp. TaxID=455651 RepID=UPI00262EA343|nr:sarcosine oxidase subunit gamma family protein [uncultured Tateyamaria sp.]
MAELIAKTPFDGMAPVTHGSVTLREVDLGVLTSIAPLKGQGKAAAAAFKEAHGIAWPAPNRATGKEGGRAIWFGRETVLLAGPHVDARLAEHAALTDQSDGWSAVELSGADVEDVLARLIPVDLSAATFKRGHTARSQVQHMNGSITRTGADTFLILVFRSMAGTLRHDLERAMASVATRR